MGKFFVFEGSDRCGKSTQITLTKDWLESEGYKVYTLREPGSTQLGTDLRQLLKHGGYKIHPHSLAILFMAARRELIDQAIRPAFGMGSEKSVILCDRYAMSTLVYQIMGTCPNGRERARQEAKIFMTKVHNTLIQCWPDLYLVYDVDETEYRARGEGRSNAPDRFEDDTQLLRASRQNYRDLCSATDWWSNVNKELGSTRLIYSGSDPKAVFKHTKEAIYKELHKNDKYITHNN